MQPYYNLDDSTRHIIIELIKKCLELDLGNVSFSYYQDGADFYLSENKNGWELVVKKKWDKTADIYRIIDGAINYQYSEKD